MVLPEGMTLMAFSDQINIPAYNIEESSTAGMKFKGFVKGFDFSLSYLWGRDGMPVANYNTFTPVDAVGGIAINTDLSFYRTHIFGADMAGSIGGLGVWAEAAAFLPENEVHMTTDLSALFPVGTPPEMTIIDTTILKKEVYVKFTLGADYNFSDGSYLNFQYMHGFMTERGTDNLNDYFFISFQKKFFDEKLKISPIGGGFIVSDWSDVENNYALIFIPEISYMATDNAEISLSTAIFEGNGQNMFANLSEYNMFMFKFKYSF